MKLKKKYLILVLLLFISIGFAVLTSNLSINGIASFTDASFDVHFENATIKDKNIDDGSITIGDDTVSITSTGTFEKPGDYIDTSFYVMNSGTMDASLNTLTVSGLTNELKNYFTYTLKYDIGGANVARGDVLRAGQGRKINLHIEYKYDVEQLATVSNLNITITMNYINPKKASTSTVWDYEYTGGEQYFIANKSGNYKLEVWGAQGGTKLTTGNYGGYSTGNIKLAKYDILYLNVGGEGKIGCDSVDGYRVLIQGGYNGGGDGVTWVDNKCSGSGGGATHIATSTGTLSSLKNNRESILIVAGGGGGGGYLGGTYAGSGGGFKGTDAYMSFGDYCGFGGTQTTGGANSLTNGVTDAASFGQGANSKYIANSQSTGNSSGGGGGYYGGGAGTGYGGLGGGGSGYIGNTNLTDKIMYCYNCQSSENEEDETNIKTRSTTNVSETPTSNYAKMGDGFVRITYLGK